MKKYVRDDNGNYYEKESAYMKYVGKSVAVGFTVDRNGDALIHCCGNEGAVSHWFKHFTNRTIEAKAEALANHLKMLVFTDISGEEFTKIASERGYLKEWLKANEMGV